jgi:hypothetical protein
LDQNYPNPFNPVTVIHYQLEIRSEVSVKVFDLLGHEVATLVEKDQDAGNYEVKFEAGKLSSGIYLYKIIAGKFVRTQKMILIR